MILDVPANLPNEAGPKSLLILDCYFSQGGCEQAAFDRQHQVKHFDPVAVRLLKKGLCLSMKGTMSKYKRTLTQIRNRSLIF